MASPATLTVQLTPLSVASKGLAVTEKTTDRVVVRELANGRGNYQFDYIIMAVRLGYEDFQVIRPALDVMDAGDSTDHEMEVQR